MQLVFRVNSAAFGVLPRRVTVLGSGQKVLATSADFSYDNQAPRDSFEAISRPNATWQTLILNF